MPPALPSRRETSPLSKTPVEPNPHEPPDEGRTSGRNAHMGLVAPPLVASNGPAVVGLPRAQPPLGALRAQGASPRSWAGDWGQSSCVVGMKGSPSRSSYSRGKVRGVISASSASDLAARSHITAPLSSAAPPFRRSKQCSPGQRQEEGTRRRTSVTFITQRSRLQSVGCKM